MSSTWTRMARTPSLLEHLDLSQSNCLNEVEGYNLKGIVADKIRNTTDAHLLSDVDEQLLLNIHFNQRVRIRSIVLHTTDPQKGPKTIKLLVNRTAIAFEDVLDAEEPEVAQVLEVSDDTVKEGQPIELKFVRFQSVNSLHIFVESNHGGGEQTRIDSIDIFGFPCGATKDLSELKKQQDD
ncbi:PITH domain-containing protein [Lactarius akahatsu]|uniref:PITH domain-containing protein n=1 Tax=Lactarius akahatsu TaxID=416441 RepID=A0AAD4LQW9_9AGAM|nr:PITH domain-containing protein [Lactarius akahatsu]